jgi:hypothetical protein
VNPTLAVKSVSRIIPAALRPNDLSILIHWIDRSTPGVTGLRALGSMVLSTMVVCLLNLGGPTSWPLCVVPSYTVPALPVFRSVSVLFRILSMPLKLKNMAEIRKSMCVRYGFRSYRDMRGHCSHGAVAALPWDRSPHGGGSMVPCSRRRGRRTEVSPTLSLSAS